MYWDGQQILPLRGHLFFSGSCCTPNIVSAMFLAIISPNSVAADTRHNAGLAASQPGRAGDVWSAGDGPLQRELLSQPDGPQPGPAVRHRQTDSGEEGVRQACQPPP